MTQEVTRFDDKAAINLGHFVSPGYVNPPGEVEMIGTDKLKVKL